MFYFLYGVIFLVAAFQVQHYSALLPDTMATRFDLAGDPNGWMTKRGFIMFYTALLIGMTGGFALASLWVGRLPDSKINIPHKAYWLAPERREKSIRSLRRMTDTMGVVTGFYIVLLMQAVIFTNLTDRPSIGFNQIMPSLGVLLAFTLSTLIYIRRRFRAPGTK